jgi:diguanylate cyclase (GGDEF)-like protein
VDIAARCGHDQLAVIFPETYSSRAVLVGERIREKISGRALSEDMRKLRVTASIGVVSFPTHAREENDLMSKALEFLEEAQSRGGDCVFNG